MPENLAVTLGEGGLAGNLSALVPLVMNRLARPENEAGKAA